MDAVLENYHPWCDDFCLGSALDDDSSESEYSTDDDDHVQDDASMWSPVAMQKLFGNSEKTKRLAPMQVKSLFDRASLNGDNVQIECKAFDADPFRSMFCKERDIFTVFGGTMKRDSVIVAVEATVVCHNDVLIRRGMLNEDVELPFVPGSNFVGIAHTCGPDSKWQRNQRVASLCKWGSNACFAAGRKFVEVPKCVDAAEACVTLQSWLPAFQALMHGKNPTQRHSPNSLKGKRVLISNGMCAEGQAAIRLAYWAGAETVYVIGPPRYHKNFRASGAEPLPDADWLPTVKGRIHLMLHFGYPNRKVQKALQRKGRLVCFARYVPKEPGFSWLSQLHLFYEQSAVSMIKRASLYDVMFSFEHFPEQFKRDVEFLFGLLIQRQIRPKIDRYISLDGVAAAHDDLERNHVSGAIVCEPWRE